MNTALAQPLPDYTNGQLVCGDPSQVLLANMLDASTTENSTNFSTPLLALVDASSPLLPMDMDAALADSTIDDLFSDDVASVLFDTSNKRESDLRFLTPESAYTKISEWRPSSPLFSMQCPSSPIPCNDLLDSFDLPPPPQGSLFHNLDATSMSQFYDSGVPMELFALDTIPTSSNASQLDDIVFYDFPPTKQTTVHVEVKDTVLPEPVAEVKVQRGPATASFIIGGPEPLEESSCASSPSIRIAVSPHCAEAIQRVLATPPKSTPQIADLLDAFSIPSEVRPALMQVFSIAISKGVTCHSAWNIVGSVGVLQGQPFQWGPNQGLLSDWTMQYKPVAENGLLIPPGLLEVTPSAFLAALAVLRIRCIFASSTRPPHGKMLHLFFTDGVVACSLKAKTFNIVKGIFSRIVNTRGLVRRGAPFAHGTVASVDFYPARATPSPSAKPYQIPFTFPVTDSKTRMLWSFMSAATKAKYPKLGEEWDNICCGQAGESDNIRVQSTVDCAIRWFNIDATASSKRAMPQSSSVHKRVRTA